MEPPREMPHQPSAVEAFLAAQCLSLLLLLASLLLCFLLKFWESGELTRYPMNSVASSFNAVLGRAMPKVSPPVPELPGTFHVLKLIPDSGSL